MLQVFSSTRESIKDRKRHAGGIRTLRYGAHRCSSLSRCVALLLIRRCRRVSNSPGAKSAIRLLSFCCFAAYPFNQAAWESTGGTITLDAVIPFHLCDIAAFLCGFALITRRYLLCELSYFWGLAGTLQGLLTPNLPYDFPHPVFLRLFHAARGRCHHGLSPAPGARMASASGSVDAGIRLVTPLRCCCHSGEPYPWYQFWVPDAQTHRGQPAGHHAGMARLYSFPHLHWRA